MVCAILITQIVHNFEICKSVRYLLKIFRGMWACATSKLSVWKSHLVGQMGSIYYQEQRIGALGFEKILLNRV